MRLTLSALAMSLVAAACTTAQASMPAEPPAPIRPSPPIAGGYGGPIDLDDDMAKAAQAVAVEAIYTRNPTRALVEKVSAELQVVAGINYRFHIKMTGGATYAVVVYRNLQGGMSVTSYEKVA